MVVTDTLSNSVLFSGATPGNPICLDSATSANAIICSTNSLASQAVFQVYIHATLPLTATGQLNSEAEVSSATLDPNPNNNFAMASTTIDAVKPQVDWVAPVVDGKVYYAFSEIIHLVANSSDNIGVAGVRFYRWDKVTLRFVDIGYTYESPFEWFLDSKTLYPGWNEIDIDAYDKAGNVSDHKFIFIFLSQPYLPLIMQSK